MTDPVVLSEVLEKWMRDKALSVAEPGALRGLLWVFGDSELGRDPGGFLTALYGACAAADAHNLDRLAMAFPEEVTLWEAVRADRAGAEGRVRAFELATAFRFGMPLPLERDAREVNP